MTSGLGLPLPGVLTEYRVFPADGLVAVPDYFTDEEMSCLPIAAVTAWTSINWMQPMGKPIQDSNTTVLFQGTGGVAINGLQIAKACGLKGEPCTQHSEYSTRLTDVDSNRYFVLR